MSVDAPVRPTATAKAAPGAVVGQLARVETRRLLTHPATLAGVVLAALHTWALLIDAAGLVLPRESVVLQSAALTLGAAVLVATHLTITRTRRDHVGELLAPARHGTDALTRAVLIAVAGAAAATALLVAAALSGFAVAGAIGTVDLAEAATAPAVVAFAGVLGVLLGRLAPWRGTPLLAIAAFGVLHVVLAQPLPPLGHPRISQLFVPVVLPTRGITFDVAATVRPATAHLVYVLALTATLAGIAALLSRRSPRRIGALLLAIVATGTAGAAQLRPVDDATEQRLVTAVAAPEQVSDCIDTASGATVCALPPYEPWRNQWATVVEGVRTPVAAAGIDLPPLTVVQRAESFTASDSLLRGVDDPQRIDDVLSRMQPADRYSDVLDDRLAMTFEWPAAGQAHGAARLALGMQVARAILDLPAGVDVVVEDPTGGSETRLSCDPTGQAREVLALWLAAQGDPIAETELRRDPDRGAPPGARTPVASPSIGIEDEQLWSREPARTIAIELLDRPDGEVLNELTEDWGRWRSPTTTVDELVAALDLDFPADELPAPAPLLEPGSDNRIVTTQQALDELTDIGATGCP